MKKILNNTVSILFFVLLLPVFSCGDNTQDRAEQLLLQANKECDKGNYDKTLALIDTLRNKYPKAIEARKQALKLYSEASEKQAQKRLDEIVVELDKAEKQYANLKSIVESHKKNNKATAEELTNLTLSRLHRDSVKTMFDTECEKIKFIRKKRQKDIE